MDNLENQFDYADFSMVQVYIPSNISERKGD